MSDKKKFPVSISLDEETRSRLQTYATIKHTSVSAVVTEWVRSLDLVGVDGRGNKGVQRLKHLAKILGNGFGITVIDFEPVIYKELGNGYNVEISGLYKERVSQAVDTSKLWAHIHLWRGNTFLDCKHIVCVCYVPFDKIVDEVNGLYDYSMKLEDADASVGEYIPVAGIDYLLCGSKSQIEAGFKKRRAEIDAMQTARLLC